MQDTVTVGHVVSGTVGPVATAVIGVLASGATGLVRSGTKWLDGKLGTADTGFTHALGPVWPVVVLGLSAALPMISNVIGVSHLPTAAVIEAAPVSALVGIVVREGLRRLFPKADPPKGVGL